MLESGPTGNQGDLVGRVPIGLDQELDGVGSLRLGACPGERHFDEMHARIALGARDRKVEAGDRPAEPGMNGNVAAADVIERAQRVVGRMLDLAIAVHRRAGDQLEIGMERREHDCDGVVRAGVDVEDELASWHHGSADR